MIWLFLASAASGADSLDLVLHDPSSSVRPADTCDQPLCTTLVSLIDRAQHSIDLAFYGFRDQTALFEAVTRAHQRGVRVRLVVDKDVRGRNYYTSTEQWIEAFGAQDDEAVDQRTAAKQRRFYGKAKCPRPAGFYGPLQCTAYDLGDRCYLAAHASREPITFQGHIMHDKFAVIDARYVWTGSANASDSGTGGYNANLVVRLDSPEVARWYSAEFDQMYIHGRFHHDKEPTPPRRTWIVPDQVHVSAFFSPQDRAVTRALRPILQGAKHRIDVAVFFLTHKHLTRDLIEAHQRGVQVRVILDATAAKNEYTKHEILRAAGIPVKVEAWGGKMHAKGAVVDGNVVVAGSMNWTRAGEHDNDENTLIIRSKRHARQFHAWFDWLWAHPGSGSISGRPDPESAESGTSCTDGVDNDFDGLADSADPGCGAAPPPLPHLPPGQIVPHQPGQECAWPAQ